MGKRDSRVPSSPPMGREDFQIGEPGLGGGELQELGGGSRGDEVVVGEAGAVEEDEVVGVEAGVDEEGANQLCAAAERRAAVLFLGDVAQQQFCMQILADLVGEGQILDERRRKMFGE